ncbi:MAG: ornithine--oxo-acid transaminase [Halanaerobiales bacterium]|nr:ornithine--oxo-acid transaminase [Halanaerobiales bacterium]
MNKSEEIIKLTNHYGAANYLPLPIVISEAEGVWVQDPEGTKYMDMLSAYSAVSHGHRHPKIIKAMKEQADRVTLTSRAFHNDQLGLFYQKIVEITGKNMVLPMNTGAEAVETALKTARRWAYQNKKVPENQAEIIVCSNNFHGRTISIITFSSTEEYRAGFGPFTPGFKMIPYGDITALKNSITPNTAAFMVEPIQGEGGIIIPPAGYLKEAAKICQDNNILLIADEIQTGLGRTGKMFGCDWEEVQPDLYILGKALGGGVMPVSAVAGDQATLGVFEPGSHGSTFGGNPLGCAIAIAAIDVLLAENLVARSLEMGQYLMEQLHTIENPIIKEIRGRGLFVGIELKEKARPYCEELKKLGVLAKETHENVIRFAPPLIITKDELNWAIERIKKVLNR